MRRRILYIDDDADHLAMVRQLLETSLPDVLVDVCTTEAGAEAHLNASCYDLIMSDFCLPPGTATGATIAEKVLTRDPNQPFYLMSEYIGGNVKAEAARVGLELHGKLSTVGRDEFLSRVQALLARKHCDGVTRRSQTSSIAESAEARASSTPAMSSGSHRQARRARPTPISLRSPYVMAALVALGRG